MLLLVVAHHIGAADIGFPLIEHRTEIKKNRVVLSDFANRRIFRKDAHGIRIGAVDPLVPMFAHAE